jgi:catechol 2,3-dioxygenase-like lactoylglutathione lyase family enzyme
MLKHHAGGVHHIGLATLDMDETLDFYTRKLGFEVAWCDIIEAPKGGKIKHAFVDTGDGTLFAFMCPEKFPGVPEEFSTDINKAQNLPNMLYHHAFGTESVEALEAKREELISKGIEVTAVMDHGWCKSIYFRDPNGLQLEYCVSTREFTDDDKIMKHRHQPGVEAKSPDDLKLFQRMLGSSGNPAPAK